MRDSPADSASESESDGDEQATADGAASSASASASASASVSGIPARFAGKTLYEVLGVPRDAPADQIKKAYRRMALSCHPDLNKAPTATAEFQYLSRCHELLSDPVRRRRYDATGSTGAAADEGDAMDAAEASADAYEYWRSVFPKISAADIEAYRARYIGGDEERDDVCAAWDQFGGDLGAVMQSVPFADSASVQRLCAIIHSERGARITKKAQTELARSMAEEEGGEAEEAEEALQQLSANEQRIMRASMAGGSGSGGAGAGTGSSGESALAVIFAQRARDRAQAGSSFMAQMEAKYAPKSTAKGKAGAKRKGSAAAPADEPSEEEFSRVQARMQQTKQQNKSPHKKRKQ